MSASFDSSDRSGSESISTVSTRSDPTHPAGSFVNVSLSDLRFVHKLGSGDIGNVYLAELLSCADSKRRRTLAAKVMDKQEIAGRNKEGRARTEREILQMLDHPFLPKLYGVAESDEVSCLLTEFCTGGDLHILRQRQVGKRFSESAVRFYASEVVVALEYMHMLGIVYRDLKPENVLIQSDGHIMLTDFDLSLKSDVESSPAVQLIPSKNKVSLPASSINSSCILPSCIVPSASCFKPKCKSRKSKLGKRYDGGFQFVAEPVDLRSMSFVGTHEYLAPEIVSGEGHGSTVDWWTLGIFMYELLYGVTPFKGTDNELTLANIVARALEFPKDPPISNSTKELIAGLLVKDPTKRIGSTTGATAIRRHPFFSRVNWALLRCASPPYIPPPFSSRNLDSSEDDSVPGTPVDVDYY